MESLLGLQNNVKTSIALLFYCPNTNAKDAVDQEKSLTSLLLVNMLKRLLS